jgi:hypothetical protein
MRLNVLYEDVTRWIKYGGLVVGGCSIGDVTLYEFSDGVCLIHFAGVRYVLRGTCGYGKSVIAKDGMIYTGPEELKRRYWEMLAIAHDSKVLGRKPEEGHIGDKKIIELALKELKDEGAECG